MTRVVIFIVTVVLLLASTMTSGPVGGADAQGKKKKKTKYARAVESCNRCHPKMYEEWQDSGHSRSWTNPVFQAQIAEREDKGEACARCHAPDTIVPAGAGKPPKARANDREFGVNCQTCHVNEKDYYGPIPSKHHKGVKVLEDYRSSNWCKSCHGQPDISEHDHYTTYESGSAQADGQLCQSCHMPEVNRPMSHMKRKNKNDQGPMDIRKHMFSSDYGTALQITGKVEDSLVLELAPHGGHSLLVGSGKQLEVEIVYQGADGKKLSDKREVFKAGGDHDVLRAKKQTLKLAWPEGAASAQVKATLVSLVVPGRDKEERRLLTETTIKRK